MENPNEQIIIIQKNAPKVTLIPEDLYEWNILEVKTPQEIFALAVQGAMAKNKGELETAIPLLEQAALYENVASLIDLADICEGQDNWIQATKWYVLAFQIQWLQTATHHPKAKRWLEELTGKYPSIKGCFDNLEQEKFQLFCNNITQGGFFSHYPLQKSSSSTENPKKIQQSIQPTRKLNTKSMSGRNAEKFVEKQQKERDEWLQLEDLKYRLRKLVEFYDGHKSHEPFLTPEEESLKSDWVQKKCIDSNVSLAGAREMTGIELFNSGCFKGAAYFLHTLNTPLALEKLGIIYETGCPGIVQDRQKAADYYRRSKTCLSYQKLANLYEGGHLGKIDYQEVVNIYELSGDPDYLNDAGLLYEGTDDLLYKGTKLGKPNYKKAKECYQRSKTPKAFMNLGILFESGKLGKPNLKEAVECYERSQEPFALYRLGYLYELGKLGKPDYQKSLQYYIQSGTPASYANAMGLCMAGKVEEEGCQIAHKSLLEFQHPYKNLMLIKLYKTEKFCLKIQLVNPEMQVEVLTNQLLKNLNTLQPSQQAFIQGILESFKDNYDDALLHLPEALALGEKHAEQYLNIVAELQATQQKLDIQKELLTQGVIENAERTSEEAFSEEEIGDDSKEFIEKSQHISLQEGDEMSQKSS
jgi:hypothetical protein